MPMLTIRNVPARVVRSLKALARRRQRSMEQEVRELLEAHVAERRSVLEQIEAGWARQARRPTAAEVDAWIGAARSWKPRKPPPARRPSSPGSSSG
jgi:plasmid stability protein